MPDRFTLLVEACRSIAMSTLPPGRVLGCGGCPAVLTGLFWARPDDLADPYTAPVWCTACALRRHLVVLRAEPATEDDEAWTAARLPEPDLVTVVFPGGAQIQVERSTLQWEDDA